MDDSVILQLLQIRWSALYGAILVLLILYLIKSMFERLSLAIIACTSYGSSPTLYKTNAVIWLVQGMSEDVSINKFFDDPMLLELARQDADLQQIL